ncbi:MAG: hypothetical protein JW395_3376 [Nitrospira sp.]|nr:hypothetical protein [Nitrospira sp.]
MTAFKDHKLSSRTKVLMIADNGAGKTGLLATLANAGHKLRVLDFDNGLDVLASYLTPKGVENVIFETLSDDIANSAATAYMRARTLIYNGWKTESDGDLGHITKWGPDTTLVIDTLSGLSDACLRDVLKKNGKRPQDNPAQADWGTAQREITNLLTYVLGDAVKCNVVVNTHPVLITDESDITRMYPNSCGRGLSTRVGTFFNNVFRIDVKPDGKRVIRTQADHRTTLKSAAPTVLAKEEAFDLAAVFDKIQGQAKTKLETKE